MSRATRAGDVRDDWRWVDALTNMDFLPPAMAPGVRIRVKTGWSECGKHGAVLAVVRHDQFWAVVVWDEENDPDVHKLAGLEVFRP